ncbi:DUF6557 family protein [Zunongwangia sp. H14]|uniref:DUF6557 family protein n=1 Tax=Zunongwangia sp. H14 TaxID=3240792 RepID=UPI00356218EC
MTLKTLIQNNYWLSVAPGLIELFPEEEENIENYKRVFNKLLIMNPEESGMAIVIKSVADDFDAEEYVDVSGKCKHPQNEEEAFLQAIEFTPWNKWLGMEIGSEGLEKFSEVEILAHCLYEMTFAGFEEEVVQEQLESLKNTGEDYEMMSEEEKRNNTISLDEFLDKLEVDDQENDHS